MFLFAWFLKIYIFFVLCCSTISPIAKLFFHSTYLGWRMMMVSFGIEFLIFFFFNTKSIMMNMFCYVNFMYFQYGWTYKSRILLFRHASKFKRNNLKVTWLSRLMFCFMNDLRTSSFQLNTILFSKSLIF